MGCDSGEADSNGRLRAQGPEAILKRKKGLVEGDTNPAPRKDAGQVSPVNGTVNATRRRGRARPRGPRRPPPGRRPRHAAAYPGGAHLAKRKHAAPRGGRGPRASRRPRGEGGGGSGRPVRPARVAASPGPTAVSGGRPGGRRA